MRNIVVLLLGMVAGRIPSVRERVEFSPLHQNEAPPQELPRPVIALPVARSSIPDIPHEFMPDRPHIQMAYVEIPDEDVEVAPQQVAVPGRDARRVPLRRPRDAAIGVANERTIVLIHVFWITFYALCFAAIVYLGIKGYLEV